MSALGKIIQVWLLAIALACCPAQAQAQELLQVTWPTKLAAKPAAFQGTAADLLPAFRIGLATLSERQVVALALAGPAVLGLNDADAKELAPLADARYKLIEADPVFSKAPSALPYCFSERQPSNGLAMVYVPKGADAKARVMVFIHGLGGSFLWYQHLLAEAFPDRIIICPAYGIVSKDIPAAYVAECMDAVAKKLGHPLPKPDLAGLSNGGLGACQVYTDAPGSFGRLLVIAAYPPKDTADQFRKEMSAYFIAGENEAYVASGYYAEMIKAAAARGATVRGDVIAGGNHFFLLTHKDETVKLLREWDAAAR